MKSNNTKHRMLVEAKRIAKTEFKNKKEFILGEWALVDASIYKNREITRICDLFDFDEDRFREMIRRFEKSKSEVELVENE